MVGVLIANAVIDTVLIYYMCHCSRVLRRYNPMIVDRVGIIKYALFTYITCGLYGIYFAYKISDDVSEVGVSFNVKTKLKGWIGLLLLFMGDIVGKVVPFVVKQITKGKVSRLADRAGDKAGKLIKDTSVVDFMGNIAGNSAQKATESAVNNTINVGVLIGCVTVATIIGLVCKVVFMLLLNKDMKKLKMNVASNLDVITTSNMKATYIKKSASAANKIAKSSIKEGKELTKQVVSQQAAEVQEQISNSLQDTTGHVKALQDMRQQLEDKTNGVE